MVGYKININIAIFYQQTANSMVKGNIRTRVYLQVQIGNAAGISSSGINHNDLNIGDWQLYAPLPFAKV
jgi:hypothetical protein